MMKRRGALRTAALMAMAAVLFTGCSGGKTQETTAAAAQETTVQETKAEETKAEETTAAAEEKAAAETTAPAKAALPVPGADGKITERQALEVALQHAGVQEGSISRQEIELDNEHGRQIYEVGFHVGRMEYDYDIDAATGEILEYEIEKDD